MRNEECWLRISGTTTTPKLGLRGHDVSVELVTPKGAFPVPCLSMHVDASGGNQKAQVTLTCSLGELGREGNGRKLTDQGSDGEDV